MGACAMAAEAAQDLRTVLADLSASTRAALSALEGDPIERRAPAAQLDAVFAASVPYEFDAAVLAAYTDPRWFSSLAPSGDGAPLLELRRWPGDSVLALYAIEASVTECVAAGPPIPEARFEIVPGSTEKWAEWRGTVADDTGDHPAIWSVQAIGESSAALGTLLLPGDAGLGAGAVPGLTEELRAVLRRVVVHEDLWRRHLGRALGAPIVVPQLASAPLPRAESEDPWQVALGSSFTLGLPPGVRARRTDAGVPAPVEVPGGVLWLRGRYTDIAGTAVTLGDAERAGYVAETAATDAAWVAGESAPRGAPSARRVAGQPFPLLKEHTGCKAGRAERWKEPGFAGEWLVFRLVFETRGIEIGLPVIEGRSSPSLYWVATSFRGAGEPPAPPPVDPAERFGIRFERLGRADKARHPWMEGYLSAPGLRAELPTGWWPSASLRSKSGYPIRLIDYASGATLAEIDRLGAERLPDAAEPGAEWAEDPRARVFRAARVLRRKDGSVLFVAHEGHAFLFEIAEPNRVPADAWKRLGDSVQLLRSAR